MLVQAKILIGTHRHGNRTYGVGEIAPVPEIFIKEIPKKFEVVKEEVTETPAPAVVEEPIIEEPVTDIEVEVEPEIKSDEISSLIIEGEELNELGFPVAFLPKSNYDKFEALPDDTVYPFNYSPKSQWYFLSNGCKVLGKSEAERGEKLIQLVYGK